MPVSVAQHLPRFAAKERDSLDGVHRIKPFGMAPAQPVAEQVAEAEERGRRLGREAAIAELERLRSDEKKAYETAMAESQRRQLAAIADGLAERLAGELNGIAQTIGNTVSRVLGPFLTSAIRKRAVDEMAETVLALLHGGQHLRIEISGDSELVAQLSARLSRYPHAVSTTDGEAPDLRVALDDTMVETRIAAWMAELTAASAEKPDG